MFMEKVYNEVVEVVKVNGGDVELNGYVEVNDLYCYIYDNYHNRIDLHVKDNTFCINPYCLKVEPKILLKVIEVLTKNHFTFTY